MAEWAVYYTPLHYKLKFHHNEPFFKKVSIKMSTLEPAITERIQSEINSQDVVLFMKGTPVSPQCGFSAAVVGVLSHLGVQFRGVNVLEDNDIREGIKTFSDWPTIPQLYLKGEFMGGCDIIREMYETGELMEMFNTHGVDVSPQ